MIVIFNASIYPILMLDLFTAVYGFVYGSAVKSRKYWSQLGNSAFLSHPTVCA